MAGDALTAVRIPSAVPALGPARGMQASLAAPQCARKLFWKAKLPESKRAKPRPFFAITLPLCPDT